MSSWLRSGSGNIKREERGWKLRRILEKKRGRYRDGRWRISMFLGCLNEVGAVVSVLTHSLAVCKEHLSVEE